MTSEQVTAHGFAICEKPERYIQQLVSHWSHKMAATYDEGDGMGNFPFSATTNATMCAHEKGIEIALTTADMEENERMRGIIEAHLDRFAFREAPLDYSWEASQPEAGR